MHATQQRTSMAQHTMSMAPPCSLRPACMIHRPSRRVASIVCMAHPRRVAKVSSQIQREISEMFIYDKVVQAAICPERRAGLDDSLSAVASITHVYVSNDLQVVKVYVSVYSDDRGKQQAIDNLVRIAPYVRSRIGAALKLRLTPEIRFEYDDAYDELEKIQAAIGQDDFNRYIAEAESDRRGSSSSSQPAAAGAAGAADEAGAAADDDDSGFFDIQDDEEEPDGDAAGPGPGSSSRSVSWSRHDPATFFAVDADEDEEYEGVQDDDAWYSRAGPFDDLFSGGGDGLVDEKQQPQQRRRGKGNKSQKQLQQ